MMAAEALGQALGQHALALWLAGSATALAFAGGLWRCVQRAAARPLAPRRAALRWALWWALPAALLFAALASQIAPGMPLSRFDAALAATLGAQLSATALHLALVPTWAGNPPVVAALAVAVSAWLWWRREHALALAWVAAVAGNALLNRGLKEAFQRPRPPHTHGVLGETGFSFPSGHASGTLVAYGMLACVVLRLAPRAWHLPALLGTAWLAWSGACSRVLLQVHYASDVVAGLASGSVWLGLCILGLRLAQAAPGLPR
jgi:undecaprenyl-diphosphatase